MRPVRHRPIPDFGSPAGRYHDAPGCCASRRTPPVILSAAFFGGLWGVVYALLEPRLTARLGWWAGGLAFGVLPLLVLWFVALPLKGLPVGGGFAPAGVAVAVVLHAVFGLGTAAF